MKKKILLGLSLILALSSTGCVQSIDIEGDQEKMAIQYMVYSVLEHDKNYLVNLEQGETTTQKEEETSKEEETTTMKPSDDNDDDGTNTGTDNEGTTVTSTNLADALGINGISITYCGYEVCDEYPKSEGVPVFVVKAVKDKDLVVLKFDMKNTTNSSINVDISSMEVYFRGVFSKSAKTNAMITLLTDALNTYKGTLAAGETVSTVLIFELNEKATKDISSITIDVKSGDETKSVKIK
ncbi:MAG: hypothetical protein IJV71_11280 [Lachnospiraceae bacterium]|nr:hypothetical protein [Lachnospiraceae bacterium]